ncbi:hypothetical protein C7476_101217 [Phyllobacterium bourgognense]|uniref:Uncharacterized protein n=1 Tax=Phyllobacterium bourgognense TaxID=314236 RepID=A0A368Z4T0_9HYPH|nr:hypothetical protein C7476_101217 [Phyllobacterium bourgognense]
MAGIGEGKLKSLKYMRDSPLHHLFADKLSKEVKVYLEFITNQIGNIHILKTWFKVLC